jgi:small subunit ribosomal protein S3
MESDSISEVITHIEIQKEIDTIHVIIHIGFPNLLKKKGAIEELEKDLQKEVNSVNQRLNIAIEKVKEPYRQPNILAEYIAFQLKNRVSFRKAMKKAIELTKKADIKGIKIQIAGRLAGKEIARAECIKKGRLPLQTIRAKIDYCCYPIRTIYGVLGVKIWIFVEEE